MPTDQNALGEIRREIDAIDDQLHDLLVRRAAMVDRVRAAKGTGDDGASAWRPGREAEILRRLAARHDGALPMAAVVRIWRELMSALVGMQGPFAVAVFDDADHGYWDLARDHFGGVVPLTRHGSARGVIQALGESPATLGVLPVPHDGEPDPWWPVLVGSAAGPLRIAARLPFVRGGNARGVDALVIGAMEQEPTGDDRSYILIEAAGAVSRATLTGKLKDCGLAPVFLTGRTEKGAPPLYLAEVTEFIAPGDERLADASAEGSPIAAAWAVGGYAVPLGGDGR
jgi:chorismate mutase/prephenate dehydratase